MSEAVRVNLHVAPSVSSILDGLAVETGLSKGQVVRDALDLFARARAATKAGRHVGEADDPSPFRRVLMAPG